MTKFYVIAGSTRFVIKEVEADTREQAEAIAYETDPAHWDRAITSDNFEHYETCYEDEPSMYVGELKETA